MYNFPPGWCLALRAKNHNPDAQRGCFTCCPHVMAPWRLLVEVIAYQSRLRILSVYFRPALQETTAWALGQVFEHLHGNENEGQPPIIPKDSIPALLAALVESLKDEPRVVYYVCDAMRYLALGFQSSDGELLV